jgi:hypothetical protein
MNTQDQTTLDFIQTRSRRTDGETSREAAKAAASGKADLERDCIHAAVRAAREDLHGLTAKEVAAMTKIDYIEVQRRISECGLTKTSERRDGCYVWSAI